MNNPYVNGTWTEAKFRNFIKNGLRSLSLKWPCKHSVKKKAWKKRGWYECAGYNRKPHLVQSKEIQIDHIEPVINPKQGFVDWNTLIERMFVDDNKLQALCTECHLKKSKEEKRNGRRS